MKYFSIKTNDQSTIKKVLNNQNVLKITKLTWHKDEVNIGDIIYYIISGDKNKKKIDYDNGLRAISKVVREPYEISGKSYSIDIEILTLFEKSITKDDFYPYPKLKNVGNLGPETKQAPNQAIRKLSIEEAYNVCLALKDMSYTEYFDELFLAKPKLELEKLVVLQKNPSKELLIDNEPKIQEYADLLDYKKQIILKGPPGTGKTKYAEEIAKFIISNQIDFNSSEKYRLTKEDILKNISVGLEIPSKSGRTRYTIVEINDGHIVSRSENSKPWYPTFNKIILSFNNELYKEKNRTSGFESYEDAIAKYLSEIINKEELKTVDIINYDLETSPFYKIVQFHPSYTYEDFVRGIATKPTENGKGVVFEGVDKVLADFATKAYDNPSKKYVLVIDEINRANLSSVFGELIYTLEYRDKTVTTMYEVDHSNELTLPSNLYIIGTMNTADRSVGHIDYAIRRRFAFVHIGPKILPSNDTLIFASDLFIKVEQIFKDHISTEFKIEDVQLGHSYFIDKSDEKGSMPIRLEYEIKPILIEYVSDGILKEAALEDINNL